MRIVELGETNRISLKRSGLHGSKEDVKSVEDIIGAVKEGGDQALFQFTKQFDGANLNDLRVSSTEIEAAYSVIDSQVLEAIKQAISNIKSFHQQQKGKSWFQTTKDGTILGQQLTPLDSAGIYVPGGKAAYPSTIMMNAIPAQVAGVESITMVSPPDPNGTLPPGVLVTANELGVDTIYKVGGAQAIAALAYGTETIKPVDKITGPGNQYVTLAKRSVFGDVDIDMIAGPSEICVLADSQANPSYIAADLLSQAEHDELATSILVTDSKELAITVKKEVGSQLQSLPKKEIAAKAIGTFGTIYLVPTLDKAIDVVNQLAPEHLEIMTEEPILLLGKIKHAGAIFLGPYSTEPVGDYFAGPNHVLPTNGTARFSSPLSVDDFMKKSSVISYSRDALKQNAALITALARLEGLEAHARAVDKRMEEWL
ncbi:histidinol dehydrogenase [Bacillus sp. JCM 19041]|uniref:histidinol dehydrogenase n=1 Tax=Bacillus sp. JCM 19041 TaxID=1460637 RepID=UPI0006D15A38